MSYNIKLSNGTSLLDIKPLEGNGLGNTSTSLQVQDIEYKDISFGLPLANRPDCFIVLGDVRDQYVQGLTFTVSGDTGYDGTYVVNLSGYNPQDRVAAFVDGATHIPVASISTGAYDLAYIAPTRNKFKILGISNASNVFLPGRTMTFAENSYAPINGTTLVIQSATSSRPFSVIGVNPTDKSFTIAGDVRDFFDVNSLIDYTGPGTLAGWGAYKIASISLVSGNTVIFTNSTYRPIPAGAAVTSNTFITPRIPVAIITSLTPVVTQAAADGVLVPQAPTTLTFAIAPSITSVSPQNYLVTWRVTGTWASQLIPGTLVQVKNARYGTSRYTTTFAVTSVSQFNPGGQYPQGVTEIVMALQDKGQSTPIITTDTQSRFIFPIPAVPYGLLSYNTSDAKTSLYLIGQGAPLYSSTMSWGNALQSNLVHMIENFAHSVPPTSPLRGQSWYDTSAGTMRVWDGKLVPIIGVITGTTGQWKFDGAAADLPLVGEKLVIQNNRGLGLAAREYTVSTVSQASTPATASGYTTTITIVGALPAAASTLLSQDIAAPYGTGYAKRYWKEASATNGLSQLTADARYLKTSGDVNLYNGAKLTLDSGNIEVSSGNLSFGTATDGITIANNGAAASTMTFITSSASTSTGNAVINLGQNRIVNLTTPTNPLDAANKAYVDGLANGILWLRSMVDPNLFGDSVTTPPATGSIKFTRTYIVPVGATGAWASLVGRAVVWNGTTWIDVLGRAVAPGDRFGVLINPDNDELSSLPAPTGGLAGHAGQIATVLTVSPYTYSFYTPQEPDAISVIGAPLTSANQVNYSPHFGHSYTFRGTWGTGTYGINNQWIEFVGPQMLTDGAGLRYTGNVLNVGQGAGIVVDADTVAVDTTWLTNYISSGDSLSTLAIASGVVTISASRDYYTLDLTANVTSIAFTNLPAAGKAKKVVIRIKQDATGGRTVALPSSFKAIAGSDTAVQTAANAYTYLSIETFDQGTRWEYTMKGIAA